MKYLCCVYLKPDAYKHLSASEMEKLNRDSVAYDKNLAMKGHYIASSALQPPSTAKTIRHSAGKPVVTDGPFAETKEVLGGFILIEAPDIDEALRIAQNIPVANSAPSKSVPK